MKQEICNDCKGNNVGYNAEFPRGVCLDCDSIDIVHKGEL